VGGLQLVSSVNAFSVACAGKSWAQRFRLARALDHRLSFGGAAVSTIKCGKDHEMSASSSFWPLMQRFVDTVPTVSQLRLDLPDFQPQEHLISQIDAAYTGRVVSRVVRPPGSGYALFLPRDTAPGSCPLLLDAGDEDHLLYALDRVDEKPEQKREQPHAPQRIQDWQPRYVLRNPQPLDAALFETSDQSLEATLARCWVPQLMKHCDADQRNNLAARWGFGNEGVGGLVLYRLEPDVAIVAAHDMKIDVRASCSLACGLGIAVASGRRSGVITVMLLLFALQMWRTHAGLFNMNSRVRAIDLSLVVKSPEMESG
jgi:hypothetical protein